MRFSLIAAVFATPALGALVTSTLPWADGNTIVLSVTTDALGDVLTQTVSTITSGAAAAGGTTSVTTTTKKGGTTTTTTGPQTTTANQKVVGAPASTAAPMHTTTYWYPLPDGTWTSAVWSNSFVVPTVATVIVPAGTIQNYNSYQSSANSVILQSALASASGQVSPGRRQVSPPGMALEFSVGLIGSTAGIVVGMVGALWGVMAL